MHPKNFHGNLLNHYQEVVSVVWLHDPLKYINIKAHNNKYENGLKFELYRTY